VQAGLVRVERSGRERIYHLETGRLYTSAQRWLRWFDPEREIAGGELRQRGPDLPG
jgi:hypothetical protein